MTAARRALAQGVAAALGGYVLAASLEAFVIRFLRPTEWELAWISDVALAVALGVAVYLWRHLLTTRTELAERERAELVVQAQLSLAADIQRRLLPALPPPASGLQCAAALRSAGKIGGDFYDFIETDPGIWLVFVGDVSGKGIPAAMALGTLRSTFRALARQHLEPAAIAAQLSAAFMQDWGGAPYVTCIVLEFDLAAGTVTYTNAGHPRGLLIGSDGVAHLDRGGPPIGLIPNVRFDQQTVRTYPGDVYLLVTDGVTEAMDETATLDELVGAREVASLPPAQLCELVMTRALNGHGPADDPYWDDDRTVVVVSVLGSNSARCVADYPDVAVSSDSRPAHAFAVASIQEPIAGKEGTYAKWTDRHGVAARRRIDIGSGVAKS
jgi:serine phosphatase RsbU (regulator of sigma subunit)